MNSANFLLEIRRLFRIAFVQKSVVILLRAAWVGGAVYIFCWGSNRLWGWFPRQGLWILYAGLVAAAILATLLRHIKPSRAFVWRVDRTFKLDEQLYTAYERIDHLEQQPGQDAGTRMLLESDAVGSLPKLRRRVIGNSGQVQREIESTIVVLLMLLVVYLAGIGSIDRIPVGSDLGLLPVPKEPQARDIFRSGIPGDESEPEEGDQPAPQPSVAGTGLTAYCDPTQLLDQNTWQQVQEVLSRLGEDLCCGSATLVLSQALTFQDYQTAGDQFSVMAEKIVDYSDDTRQLLADSFLNASVRFQEIGQPQPSELFSADTAALLGDSYAEMAEGLDGLAVLMLGYESQQRCISVAEWQPGGQWVPAQPGTIPSDFQVFSSSVEFYSPFGASGDTGSTVIGGHAELPIYDLPMDDVDVVSSYFSPE